MRFPNVTDFVWCNGEFVDDVDLLPGSGPEAPLSGLSGHYALHQHGGSGVDLLVRDRLGVNKLFFACDEDRGVVSSNFLLDLLRQGFRPEEVWSVPSGHSVSIDTSARRLRLEACLEHEQSLPAPEKVDHATAVRNALESTFGRLRDAARDRRLYVTMSGGLDSTTIAVLAREWLGEFTGVTFSIEGSRNAKSEDDLYFAEKVASELGVKFEVVSVTADRLLELLDVSLIFGQDWRDFNVHCALVNAAIGRAIGPADGSDDGARPLILTGDTMNELVADYSPVDYRGRTYYALPELPIGRLRQVLVSGLDSGDREVGVFAHFGLDTIQPYAMCSQAYLDLPPEWLDGATAKQSLVEQVMGDRIPPYVYKRPKVRAQVASSENVGGTLATLVDHGIDQAWLSTRFAELCGIDPTWLNRLIRAGRYRFTAEYPARDCDE